MSDSLDANLLVIRLQADELAEGELATNEVFGLACDIRLLCAVAEAAQRLREYEQEGKFDGATGARGSLALALGELERVRRR